MIKKIRFEVDEDGKKDVGDCLKKNGYLTKHTEQVYIICNDGEVAQIKPLLKFK